MKDNLNIPDDSFIPEGLEFKEEYLQEALSMYDRARGKSSRRRRTWLTLMLLLIGISVLYWVKHDSGNYLLQPESRLTEQNQGAGIDSLFTNHKEQEDERLKLDIKDSSNSSRDINNLNCETTIENLKGIRISLYAKVEDQGGPSRSGSPDLLPSDSLSEVDQPRANQPVSGLMDEHQLPAGAQLPSLTNKEEDNVDVLNRYKDLIGNFLIDENTDRANFNKSYKRIVSLTPTWSANEHNLSLSHVNVLKIDSPKRIKPYLVLGISPLSTFGSKRLLMKPDPYVALGINYRLGNGWRAAMDARYYFVSGLSHPLTFTDIVYGQGFETNTTTIYTNRLHYAGIQFSLQKQLNSHQISFAYSCDYLITGQNNVEKKSNSSLEDIVTHNDKANGYVLGFKNFNHSISLGYDYWLGKNKALGMAYQFGLTDITNNRYFTTYDFDRNSMLTVRLKMYLR